MNTRPRSVTAAFLLILVNIFIWFGFGILVAGHLHPALPDQPFVQTMMALLAFAIAAVLAALYFFLARRSRVAYFLTLGLLAAVSLATFFDDFGWSDLAVLLLNLAPVALLIKDRAWYWRSVDKAPIRPES